MPIIPTSSKNIHVGYISKTSGYVKDLTISEAFDYEKLNPNTTFIFVDGDDKVRYLTMNQVAKLTTKDLLRSKSCDVRPKPNTSPKINFFGGEGIGAEANPVVDVDGNLVAVDVVNTGFGYKKAPFVQVIDRGSGSGAVVKAEIDSGGRISNAIVEDGGTGYLPPAQTSPQYPAVMRLTEVRVKNPGINYSPNDVLQITPNNGTELTYKLNPFGKVKSVNVKNGGNYTALPNIDMESDTGLNALFTPVFEIVRDPLVPEIFTPEQVVKVYDLVGLNINGYIDGMPYYGNVFFENGVKFAGIKNRGQSSVRVFDTKNESLSVDRQRRVDPTGISNVIGQIIRITGDS